MFKPSGTIHRENCNIIFLFGNRNRYMLKISHRIEYLVFIGYSVIVYGVVSSVERQGNILHMGRNWEKMV